MPKYRHRLPQLGPRLFLTDGGIETTLIFHEKLELPEFAAFDVLKSPAGEAALRRYFVQYAEIARRFDAGLILESATWRASRDWASRIGYTPAALADAVRRAVALLVEIREQYETADRPIVISGAIGPRGDGYVPAAAMSEAEAEAFHGEQMSTLAGTEVDMASGMTINYVEEAVGIVRAAQRHRLPVAVSFTVETDGRLPTGQALRAAIEQTDAATAGYAAYFAINCAHPEHIEPALADGGAWMDRVRGLRANASRKSHAELNESPDIDSGDPEELADDYARLQTRLTRLTVLGGCCGTDGRHVERIAVRCAPVFARASR